MPFHGSSRSDRKPKAFCVQGFKVSKTKKPQTAGGLKAIRLSGYPITEQVKNWPLEIQYDLIASKWLV